MINRNNNTHLLLRILQVILFTSVILYFGRTLFIPICYGLLIAIVLYPLCRWLELHGWPRSLAITAGLVIIFILFAGILGLIIVQAETFRKDLPELITKIKPALFQLQEWGDKKLGISIATQEGWWVDVIHNFNGNAGAIARQTISLTLNTIFIFFLVPVYAALFLYNRSVLVSFLAKLAGKAYEKELQSILVKVIHTYFNFIKGMMMVYLIVGILNSVGLFALGIRHALLFGMLTAVMTLVPYVGIFISALLPISMAWITKDSIWYPIGVIAVFTFVQYLEANVIFPRVVGGRLNISTLATLVAVIAGGILWGVSGMILFIPFVGILKVIIDYFPGWQALSILLNRTNEDRPNQLN